VCVFEALFKGVSTSFGLPLIENSFKNAYAMLCSAVQNLRLGSIELLKNMDSRHRIAFIEAHGTGTKVGDPIEFESMTNVLRALHSSEQKLRDFRPPLLNEEHHHT
jgi:hypothetical protein